MHILTTIIFNLVLIIITFSCNNPLILGGIFVGCVVFIINKKETRKIKKAFVYFVPFAIITSIINMIFVEQGKMLLFVLFGRKFTLEALVYAVILSFKLFLVILIFILFELMVDSDKAVSYFSSKMPKSTLMLMTTFKLFPNMKERLKNLQEIYSIRGVDVKSNKIKDRIKGSIPILSVLLESSLEGAFDIGEAAYVRGFLSGKRTIYDRQKLKNRDYILILLAVIDIILFFILKSCNYMDFDIYGVKTVNLINYGVLAVCSIIIVMFIILYVYQIKRLEENCGI